MKKQLSGLLLSLCVLGLFGCNDETPHTHRWDNGTLDNGIKVYSCLDCTETKEEDKTLLYRQTCANIATKMQNLTPPTLTQSVSPLTLNSSADANTTTPPSSDEIDESVFLEDAPDQYYIQVKGVAVFVDMLTELINNDSFRITSAPVCFTYSYERTHENGTAVLMYEFNEQTDTVTMYWDIDSTQGSSTLSIFLYIGVDYDFETQTVNAFRVYTDQTRISTQSQTENKTLNAWVYQDGVLKMPSSNTDALLYFHHLCDAQAATLATHSDDVIDLEADFTAEYTTAMNKMNG